MAISRRTRSTDEATEETPAAETPRTGGVKRTSGKKLSAWQAVGRPKEEGSGQTYEKSESVPFVTFNKASGTKYLHICHVEPQDERKQHYVASTGKFFFCYNSDLEKDDESQCALCDAGLKASWIFRFNVVEMNDDPTEIKTWDLSWTQATQLMSLADGEPLNDPDTYWKVVYVREGKKGNTTIFPIPASQLEKKHNMVPLTEEELAELEQTSYGRETVFKFGPRLVESAAEALTPGDLK